MRLQCPNCDAEYEVDASAIPYEGRDVQCSNCGHGWFQAHPDFETDYEVESALYDPPPPLPQGADVASGIPKRELPPEAMQILREEVAREEAARAADAARANSAPPPAPPSPSGIEAELDAMAAQEAQPVTEQSDAAEPAPKDSYGDIEAALDADQCSMPQPPELTAPLPRVAPRRVARLKGLNTDSAAQAAPYPAPPAEALDEAEVFASDAAKPDPDLRAGINSTKPRRSGGRAGFYTALLLALASAAVYLFSAELAALVPVLAPYLQGFVAAVNDLRDLVEVIVPQAIGGAQGIFEAVLAWIAAQGWF